MTAPVGETVVSVQTRCPNMGQHVQWGTSALVNVPCPDCYSIVVTSVAVPYRPEVRWTEVKS